MDTRRLIELAGSFVLGGGIVALTYELVGGNGSAVAMRAAQGLPDGDAVAMVEGDDAEGAGVGDESETRSSAPATNTDGSSAAGVASADVDEDGSYTSFPSVFSEEKPFTDSDESKFPKHGLVMAGAVVVRERADLESPRMGLIRAGTRVRLDGERSFGGGCSQGWHRVFPEGWICLEAGIKVGNEPPDDGLVAVAKPNLDAELPLDYWRVNHDGTPFFHRLPSYTEQDRADTAAKEWLAARGRTPMPSHPDKRPGSVPAVVKEYYNAGYYVTVSGEHVKAKRHFLRTNRGIYARKYQLGKREPSKFRGQLVPSADAMPMYFVSRSLPFMERESEGSTILVKSEEVAERRDTVKFDRRVRIGDFDYYESKDGKLLRAYAVGVARKIKRPAGIGPDEHWVHVDLSEQTLVAYEGSVPKFATLVSTGKEKGMTPVGVHRVQSKFITTTMRDQPVEDEAYSIEDVPWTQYFDNNVALHGAFWHGGFGLVRSHGCVNLSPADARWLFGFLGPAVPPGWHAAFASVGSVGQGSAVVVTE